MLCQRRVVVDCSHIYTTSLEFATIPKAGVVVGYWITITICLSNLIYLFNLVVSRFSIANFACDVNVKFQFEIDMAPHLHL